MRRRGASASTRRRPRGVWGWARATPRSATGSAPSEAAAARERGEIGLRLPTLKSLMLFDGAPSADEAIDGVVGRTITAIRPRLVIEDGQRRAILPGEPGYH